MKNSFTNKTIAFGLLSAGLAFVSSNVFAQNARIGMVFTSSAKECAMACTNDMMCAAWVFSPVKIGTTGASTGQCNFSNNSNINAPQGSQMGLPLRRTNDAKDNYSSNVPSNVSSSQNTTNNNLYQGNYSVKPLTNNSQMANNNIILNQPATPQPIQSAPKNNASVSFAPPIQPAPQYIAPVQYQPAPTQQVQQVQPQPIKLATNSPTSLSAKPAIVNQTETNNQKHPTGPLRNGQPQNMQQFVGADGMVDAAEMRRAQLRNSAQNGSTYSVQKEWNEVAQSVANGTNNPSYDYANTTPIPLPKNETNLSSDANSTQKSQEAKGKKGFLGLFNKAPETNNEGEVFGPLRRHSNAS